MRKSILLFALVALLSACGGTSSKTETTEEKPEVQYLKVGELMEFAMDSVEKKVLVTGTVTHICTHSGRRCFIIDSVGNQSIRVEAGGEINGFNRELSGMDINVKGIIKEKRLTTEYINDWEAKVKAKEGDIENKGETCSAEMTNINQMRDWMKEHNKDYYSIIYLEGLEYEVVY